jgi:predicted NBD/HSP70 family sugar kinase
MKNGSNDLIFAADLGGTHLRAATVDQKGKIRFRFKQNTPQVPDATAIVDAIVAAVRDCQKQDSGGEISAVSLVVPGTVKVEEGAVVTAPNNFTCPRFLKTTRMPPRSVRCGRARLLAARRSSA